MTILSVPLNPADPQPVLSDARLSDPAAIVLLDGLTAEYAQRYGDNAGAEMSSADPAEFDPPRGAFVLVTVAGDVLAGGGLRPLSPDRAEVKRMWTRRDRRRQGLGALVLSALTERGRALGYRELWLVTGPGQPEAVAMYDSAGWRRIANFGLYAEEPRAFSYARTL